VCRIQSHTNHFESKLEPLRRYVRNTTLHRTVWFVIVVFFFFLYFSSYSKSHGYLYAEEHLQLAHAQFYKVKQTRSVLQKVSSKSVLHVGGVDKPTTPRCVVGCRPTTAVVLAGVWRSVDVLQMYRSLGTLVYVAMSGDASCRGLRSPRDGPLVMEFTKGRSRRRRVVVSLDLSIIRPVA